MNIEIKFKLDKHLRSKLEKYLRSFQKVLLNQCFISV